MTYNHFWSLLHLAVHIVVCFFNEAAVWKWATNLVMTGRQLMYFQVSPYSYHHILMLVNHVPTVSRSWPWLTMGLVIIPGQSWLFTIVSYDSQTDPPG